MRRCMLFMLFEIFIWLEQCGSAARWQWVFIGSDQQNRKLSATRAIRVLSACDY